ncbi:MAG: hypothetical protein ACRDSZ_08085 [Pseudonocardiaceae bacterium]
MNAEQRSRHEHQQVCEEISGMLAGMLPDADRGGLEARLATLGLGPSRARSLRDYLNAYPDALSSGRSDGPSARLALLGLLAVDHPQVRLACCVCCGQAKTLPYRLGDGRADNVAWLTIDSALPLAAMGHGDAALTAINIARGNPQPTLSMRSTWNMEPPACIAALTDSIL